jgi:hypothetical protein
MDAANSCVSFQFCYLPQPQGVLSKYILPPSRIISKKITFSLSQNISKKNQFLCYFKKNHLFQSTIKCILYSICSHFYSLHNHQPIRIVFTSFHETYFKKNTKNYTSNYYVFVFLISVNLYFLLINWDGGSTPYTPYVYNMYLSLSLNVLNTSKGDKTIELNSNHHTRESN